MNDVFTQVVELARSVGMGKLGHVAIDSTRIAANAAADSAETIEKLRGGTSEDSQADTSLAAAVRAEKRRTKERGRRWREKRSGSWKSGCARYRGGSSD